MTKKLFLLLFLTSIVFSAHNNRFYFSSENLNNTDRSWQIQSQIRKYIDLNGEWEYRASLNQVWQKTIVPSAYDFQGVLTFRKSFSIDLEHLHRQFRFVAYGINYACTIKINQQYVGNHIGGYSSFILEIPDGVLRVGEQNVIEIEIDNRLNSLQTIPLAPQGQSWTNYGGIFREIFIESLPPVYIDSYQFTQQFDSKLDRADLSFSLQIRNVSGSTLDGKSFAGEIELTGSENSSAASVSYSFNLSEGFQQIKLNLPIRSPNLWSPDNPYLYTLRIRLVAGKTVVDEVQFSFGIKEFKIQGNEFFLNGTKFILKGITRYDQYEHSASVLDYRVAKKDIEQIKTLGVNTLRLSAYPNHPYILKLCDEMGLLVLEELPIFNTPAHQLSQAKYIEDAKVYAKEMVNRDVWHSCLAGWGIGNEFDTADPKSKKFVRDLVETIKLLDNRPVYYTTQMLTNDVCAAIPDFVGINIDSNTPLEFEKKILFWEKKYLQKPLVITRYGHDVFPHNRLGSGDPTSEDYQAKFILETYQFIRRNTSITGSFIESFADWRRAKPNLTGKPEEDPFVYRSGLVDLQRNERPVYKMVRALYINDKLPNILETNPSSSSQATFALSGLALFFLTVYWYRRNGRFRDNLFRVLRHPFGFFSDIRDHRTIPVLHTLMMAFIVSGIISLFITDFSYLNRRNVIYDFILSHIILNNFQKIFFINLIWNPILMLFFSMVFQLVGILVIMLFWMILTFPLSRTMGFVQAVNIGVWSGAHYLLLVPLTVFLDPILQNSNWHMFLWIIIIILVTIHISRLFLGVRLSSNLSFQTMFIVSFLFIFVIFSGIIYFYHKNQATLYYIQFLYHLITGNQIST